MNDDNQARVGNGVDLSSKQQPDYGDNADELHLAGGDEREPGNVSMTPNGPPHYFSNGISSWQPLTIRETLILLFAVGGFIYQWASLSSQMSNVLHDLTTLHQDLGTFGGNLQSHVTSPGHAIELERLAIVNGRLDDLSARVKAIEAIETHRKD